MDIFHNLNLPETCEDTGLVLRTLAESRNVLEDGTRPQDEDYYRLDVPLALLQIT